MSGIAGVMTVEGAAEAGLAERLASALAHRGPDGQGRFLTGGLALLHARLNADPAWDEGPHYGPDGLVAVVDGRFAIEAAAEPRGALERYRGDGLRFADGLAGAYALALYDPADRTLLLARDPMGVKPLYVAETGAALLFASEPKIIQQALDRPPRLSLEAVPELLQLQFLTGRQTAFAGVTRVLPGEALIVRGGRVLDRRRRAGLPAQGPARLTEEEAFARLDKALAEALRREPSAGGWGLALRRSPGTAALVAAAVRHRAPVRLAVAALPAGGRLAPRVRDVFARAAGRLGVGLALAEATPARIDEVLPRIVAACDDPAADYGALPTYLRAGAAAAEGLAALLGDEGADELFAAHGRYRALLRPVWLGGKAMRARGFLEGFGILREEGPRWRDGILSAERRVAEEALTDLQEAQAVDCTDWLPHDVLLRLDRMLGAHALAGVAPFLDADLAGLGFRLPEPLKIARGQGAVLLRRYAESVLGELAGELCGDGLSWLRPWLPRGARDWGRRVAAVPAVRAACHPGRVERLFWRCRFWPGKQVLNACWQLLFFALWARIHLEGAPGDRGIGAALGGGDA